MTIKEFQEKYSLSDMALKHIRSIHQSKKEEDRLLALGVAYGYCRGLSLVDVNCRGQLITYLIDFNTGTVKEVQEEVQEVKEEERDSR